MSDWKVAVANVLNRNKEIQSNTTQFLGEVWMELLGHDARAQPGTWFIQQMISGELPDEDAVLRLALELSNEQVMHKQQEVIECGDCGARGEVEQMERHGDYCRGHKNKKDQVH